MSSAQSPHSTVQRTKTALFCQRCDHATPIDGDWVAEEPTGHETLHCPRCDHAVVSRPTRW